MAVDEQIAQLKATYRTLKDKRTGLLAAGKRPEGEWDRQVVADAREAGQSVTDYVAAHLAPEKELAEIEEQMGAVKADIRCLRKHGVTAAEFDKQRAAERAEAAVAGMSEGERVAYREALADDD